MILIAQNVETLRSSAQPAAQTNIFQTLHALIVLSHAKLAAILHPVLIALTVSFLKAGVARVVLFLIVNPALILRIALLITEGLI